MWVAMSRREFSDTVVTASSRAATRACMPVKPYQRRSVSRRRRDRVGGQLQLPVDGDRVVDRGHGRDAGAGEAQQPPAEGLVVVDDVERRAARGSRCRAARRLKVIGSGNPAVHMVAHSATSIQSRNSDGRGVRNGSGSR